MNVIHIAKHWSRPQPEVDKFSFLLKHINNKVYWKIVAVTLEPGVLHEYFSTI